MAKVSGTFQNGGNANWVPPDIRWDEENHPVIFACSQHIEHHPRCDGNCGEPTELDSESQVELLNEGRRYARLGISFAGIPASHMGHIPVPGIPIELVDLLMWLEAVKQIILDTTPQLSEFDLEEVYREKKLEFLRSIREANEEQIKKARTQQQIAVATKPGLLGPDGQPI